MGTGGNLVTNLAGPSKVLVNSIGILDFFYANEGDADVGAPIVIMEALDGQSMGLTADAVPFKPHARIPGHSARPAPPAI